MKRFDNNIVLDNCLMSVIYDDDINIKKCLSINNNKQIIKRLTIYKNITLKVTKRKLKIYLQWIYQILDLYKRISMFN